MKTLKENFMMVVAFVITTVTLMSMTVNKANVTENLKWFTVIEGISGLEYGSNPFGGSSVPPAGCENDIENPNLCAVAFPDTEIGSNGLPIHAPDQAELENRRYEDDPQ